MAYDDWDPQLQEVYDNAVASSLFGGVELDDSDYRDVEAIFEYGWVTMPGPTQEVREVFYEMLEIDETDIDWDAWREFWGYDD